MDQWQGYITFSILLLGFVLSSAFCWILHLSMYVVDGKIAGRVAQSCLSCHFCLNLTWQLDRSCFHCLKWGGGEMGGGFLKKNYIYLFFCMQAACVCGGVGKEAPHYTIYIGSVVERAWFPPGYRFISHVKWVWIPLWRGFILPFLPNQWLLGAMHAVGTRGALCLFISLFLFYLFLFSPPFSGTVGAGWRCF